MALYDRSRDQQQLDPIDPGYTRAPLWAGNMIPSGGFQANIAFPMGKAGMTRAARKPSESIGEGKKASSVPRTTRRRTPGP